MTPKQGLLYRELSKLNEATVRELADVCGLTEKATSQHLTGMIKRDLVHVCNWTAVRGDHFIRVIRIGPGENITRSHGIERHKMAEKRRKIAEREAIRNAPARPDIAAAWLFT